MEKTPEGTIVSEGTDWRRYTNVSIVMKLSKNEMTSRDGNILCSRFRWLHDFRRGCRPYPQMDWSRTENRCGRLNDLVTWQRRIMRKGEGRYSVWTSSGQLACRVATCEKWGLIRRGAMMRQVRSLTGQQRCSLWCHSCEDHQVNGPWERKE